MNVLITGITGTLGRAIAKWHYDRGDRVFGCARNEAQVSRCRVEDPWRTGIFCHDALRLDVLLRLINEDRHVHRVYHCAATKHVENCEEFPFEAMSQNINTLLAAIAACAKHDAELVFVSSDKACMPNNTYGATKLLGEKLALAAGFAAIRLGNLIGSSGSVFTKWKAAADRGEAIMVTDITMTRFFIRVQDAVEFVTSHTRQGTLIVPNMRSIAIGEIAALWPEANIVGPRPGERMHEWAVAPGDRAVRDNGHFVLGEGDVSREGFCSKDSERWSRFEFADALAEVGCLPDTYKQPQILG